MNEEYLDDTTVKEIQDFMYEKAKGKFCFGLIMITPYFQETGEIGLIANLDIETLTEIMKGFIKKYAKTNL